VPLPNQLPKLNFQGIDPVHQQWLNQLTDFCNSLAGYNGEVELANHLNLSGNRIKNVGSPVESTDALTSGIAQQTYAVSVLAPQLEAAGSNPLTSYRQLGNPVQRESRSSFLNDLMSTTPNANQIIPTITNGMGSVTVSIPSSPFTFADGSGVNLIGRTDVLSTPAQYAISSISCTGNLVTVNCAATGLVAGQIMTVTGVTPSSFNGTVPILSSTSGGAVLEYQLDLGTVSGSGGDVQKNGVYYYAVKKRSNFISLLGPVSSDTAQNRLQANFDSFQMVAVIVITASGGQILQSGGGGSPITGAPTAGAFF